MQIDNDTINYPCLRTTKWNHIGNMEVTWNIS